jgi:hypothetical protein
VASTRRHPPHCHGPAQATQPAGQDPEARLVPGTVTVPLHSRTNASPFWIMLLLVAGRSEHGMIPVARAMKCLIRTMKKITKIAGETGTRLCDRSRSVKLRVTQGVPKMFTPILTAIGVAAALTIPPVNAANAGFLKNVKNIAKADVGGQAFLLKKDGLSGKFVKDSLKLDKAVGKALFKATF